MYYNNLTQDGNTWMAFVYVGNKFMRISGVDGFEEGSASFR
jgi:hypothetical protein